MYKNQETGILGEDIATKYLIKQGYCIYERNFKCKIGEIDIIAIDTIEKNELVFIEVKTRKQDRFGKPAESINANKIKHIYNAAEFFLMINKLEHSFIRFDIIEIYEKSSDKIQINHIKNAILEKPDRNVTFYKNENTK